MIKHVFKIHEGADDYYYVAERPKQAAELHLRLTSLRLDPVNRATEVEELDDDSWLTIYNFSDSLDTSAKPIPRTNRICRHWATREETGLLCCTAYPA